MSRRGRAVRPAMPSGRDQHLRWLDLVETSGAFLSLPVLAKQWPSGPDGMDSAARERLRTEHADFFDVGTAARDQHRWVRYVLGDLLEWDERLVASRDGDAVEQLGKLAVDVPEHDERVAPSFALVGPEGRHRLLGLVTPVGSQPTARPAGSSWSATWVDRLARVLRVHDVPLGLVTDGRWWVLVFAQCGKGTASGVFDAQLWREEAELVRAFASLLRRSRFFGVPDDATLPALFAASEDSPEDITEALGVQVRAAVELLVEAIGRADTKAMARSQRSLGEVPAHDIYAGTVIVMMRLVFLLFAEERRLLPSDNELYQAYYAAGRLAAELRERANAETEEALESSTAGWHRLLALFRAVYYGVRAAGLELSAYDGSLFDPDEYAWLEGRLSSTDDESTDVLEIDDRTLLHVLESVQYVQIGAGKNRERRKLSFAALDVEQIGYVYEGLLGYDARRAGDVIVGLVSTKTGHEAEVPLAELEALAARIGDVRKLAELLAGTYKDYNLGSATALAKRLAPLPGEGARAARRLLLAATGNDAALTERLLPFFRIIRHDLRGQPMVVQPGALFVTESPRRRNTGTHYTPRALAEQVVLGALEPLVYKPGPLQTADKSRWRRLSSEQILQLKIADIAMGSGAFLVAACRYLADHLFKAWKTEEDERAAREPVGDLDQVLRPEDDPGMVAARREIVQRCLYGGDISPMAVEMAKLSLRMVSLQAGETFSFLDDRLETGDSLLGITSFDQLEYMHINPDRGRALHENAFDFTERVRQVCGHMAAIRALIYDLGPTLEDIKQKHKHVQEARELCEKESLNLYADLIVGAALSGATGGQRLINSRSAEAAVLGHAISVEGESAYNSPRDPRDLIAEWLGTGRPDHAFKRKPIHWPLVFPEVFLGKKVGFDAIIGNPPFLGGTKISGNLGDSYRDYVECVLAGRDTGRADLVSFFVLRAHSMLGAEGQTGLIATNSLAQGDTREIALDPLANSNVEIRGAIKSEPWPSKSAALHYCVISTSRAPVAAQAVRVLDHVTVQGITPTLDPVARVKGSPCRLRINSRITFEGSKVEGMGFTMSPAEAAEFVARDARNAVVLFPFLNGKDLNSQPDHTATRWIVDFRERSEAEARSWSGPWSWIEGRVKPERLLKDARKYPRMVYEWWKHWRSRMELYQAIGPLEQVLVIAITSKVVAPTLVRTGQVYSHACCIFATDDTAMLALLSSVQHYWWAINRASTMKGDLRYTSTDVFETFAQPQLTTEMRRLGERLHGFRSKLMLARNAGLTATYNLVHNPDVSDPDIAELREIHRLIDEAVKRAYGWDDLELDHGFHETRQGVRYTVGPVVRQEILDRLLELNHERYAEEVAQGLHDKKSRKTAKPRRAATADDEAGQEGLF